MSFQRTRVLDIDLGAPLPASWDVGDYERAFVLLRWRGHPMGTVELPAPGGTLPAAALRQAVVDRTGVGWAIANQAVRHWLLGDAAEAPAAPAPTWSVIVCTRDRDEDLRRCLGALLALEPPPGAPAGEIVIVDNAPATDAAARVVAEFAGRATSVPVRYVREDRPGLNWARARGARTAVGEIVAYTDDDVVVDRCWIARMLEPFVDTRVGAVTGLTMPFELETEAQWLFERYGGFGRGFARREFDQFIIRATDAGRAGAGANMAFRRRLVVDMRLFEVELDAGTITMTGGDTYAFYRLLRDGRTIVYSPDALVWHRHRREYAPLVHTLYGYSVGGFAYLTRCLVQHGDVAALRSAYLWLRHEHVPMLARLLLGRPSALPRELVLAYWRGVLVGPWRYLQSRSRERRHLAIDAAAVAPSHPTPLSAP